MVICRQNINNHLFKVNKKNLLIKFLLLTLSMGVAWGICYLISLTYVSVLYEFIIILVFGGLSAGSIAFLSVYLPAYYAYVFPMFIPVIIYNYLVFNMGRTIFATMFILFILMLLLSAIMNKKLLDKTFQLSQDKETLIYELQITSITDPLTGLYNRRHFEVLLPQELRRAKRNQYPLNLISIDIDNFKLINDNFGHPSGDKVLVSLGSLLTHICKRANDTIFRLGGDEFAAILVNQPLGESVHICHKINNLFKRNLLNDFKSKELAILNQVTLSMGIVNIHFNSSYNMETVINVADKALYQAKKNGKNQIVIEQIH
ncbi:GGDEF domain-containing protein [Fluoribacter dumoffii]|uniref:GGDEF domain-containing protein n=1 Tax=Fluoribacter dumoffii TaxID=463 RepID=UPI0022448773|nr:GGDEF domain-containing protein [Fluoribacter dumoffii]MCW8418683.1 GGDEF domain-containing protein [Fluoribacter dumoffii]MCW8453473.1 GGDEF domain-containing protein [Fluoribacter dumoffii]MCW8459307.1 GGDEF domain-containing protein [Fluoribacter dumoffii]MCW8482666.1 GGDEF domain-containing protein [Fluoribacter dumoffii]